MKKPTTDLFHEAISDAGVLKSKLVALAEHFKASGLHTAGDERFFHL